MNNLKCPRCGYTGGGIPGGYHASCFQADRADRAEAKVADLLACCEEALWLMDRVAGWEDEGAPITTFAAEVHGKHFRDAIAKAKGGVS